MFGDLQGSDAGKPVSVLQLELIIHPNNLIITH